MGVRRGEQGGAFAPPWILGIFYHPCMALMRGFSWVAVCWHRSCLEPLQLCVYSLNIREGLRTIILSNATPANQPTEQYRRKYFLSSIMYLVYNCSGLGHGGTLVEPITLNRRVVGSTPALAAM